MQETTTTPLIPNGDDDDITPEEICEVAVNSVDESDPNAARLKWVFDLDSGDILDEPGGGTTFPVAADSRVGLVSTGAQAGWISELIIESTGDCGATDSPYGDLTVFGELPIDQSVPPYDGVISATQDAWDANDGTFTTLAYNPKTGIFTANSPHDQYGEVWVLTRGFK